jgi:transcription initiation factor TFIID subunit 5
MDLKINTEISRTNSFTFSNISSLNGSQSLVDQQVSRLVKFVQCQRNSIVRRELETLLPPIVCHLYIEMLKGREWRPAHDFLRKFSCLVGSVQEISQQKVNGSDSNLLVVPQTIHFLPQSSQTSSLQQNIVYNRITPGTSKHQAPHIISQLNLDEQKLLMFR